MNFFNSNIHVEAEYEIRTVNIVWNMKIIEETQYSGIRSVWHNTFSSIGFGIIKNSGHSYNVQINFGHGYKDAVNFNIIIYFHLRNKKNIALFFSWKCAIDWFIKSKN